MIEKKLKTPCYAHSLKKDFLEDLDVEVLLLAAWQLLTKIALKVNSELRLNMRNILVKLIKKNQGEL